MQYGIGVRSPSLNGGTSSYLRFTCAPFVLASVMSAVMRLDQVDLREQSAGGAQAVIGANRKFVPPLESIHISWV